MSESKKIPVDADFILNGDTFKPPFRRVGSRAHLVYDDGTLSDIWWQMPGTTNEGGLFGGVTVDESDIIRAPRPRERITETYEVIPREQVVAGDFADLSGCGGLYEIEPHLVRRTQSGSAWSQVARFLRRVKP